MQTTINACRKPNSQWELNHCYNRNAGDLQFHKKGWPRSPISLDLRQACTCKKKSDVSCIVAYKLDYNMLVNLENPQTLTTLKKIKNRNNFRLYNISELVLTRNMEREPQGSTPSSASCNQSSHNQELLFKIEKLQESCRFDPK
jgi:hypothetical protein